MIIHLDELSDKIQAFTFDKRLKDFPVLEEINAAGDCQFADRIDIRIGAKRLGEMVAVEGRVAATVRLVCNRCLVQFQSDLQPRFALTYTRRLPPDIDTDDDQDAELQSEQIGLIAFAGEEIDLREDVQSEIVMAIPMQPLCSQTCKGLCRQCGANRNEAACGCKSPTGDPRLAVLKELKIESK